MAGIVTLTLNPAVDKSAEIDHVVPERKLRCSRPNFHPGGGGINVSRAIRRMGGDSAAYYAAGGPMGAMLETLLSEEGIETRLIRTAGMTRENLIVYERETGQQYRFGMPGPQMQEKEWMGVLEALRQMDPKPEYLVASGSLPQGVPSDFYARIAALSKDLDANLILDTSGDSFRMAVHDQGVFLIKPNVAEIQALSDTELKSEEDRIEFAEGLLKEGKCRVIVLSLGSAGALLVWDEGHMHLRAPTVSIRSKVGAGDSMVAGIVLSLARGRSIPDAARFGVAAGAAAVMTPGTELCRREDVERLYKSIDQGSAVHHHDRA